MVTFVKYLQNWIILHIYIFSSVFSYLLNNVPCTDNRCVEKFRHYAQWCYEADINIILWWQLEDQGGQIIWLPSDSCEIRTLLESSAHFLHPPNHSYATDGPSLSYLSMAEPPHLPLTATGCTFSLSLSRHFLTQGGPVVTELVRAGDRVWINW